MPEATPHQFGHARTPSKHELTCPSCGAHTSPPLSVAPSEAQRRIAELEAQVTLLTMKATAAADRLADYEDDQRRLGESPIQQRPSTESRFSASDAGAHHALRKGSNASLDHVRDPPTAASDAAPGRFAGMLRSRKATPSPSSARTMSRDKELEAAFALERSLRQQAEDKLKQMHAEVEELTAQLFSQANDMVATERRDRAKLEEKMKVLKERESDKGRRLDQLEAAVKRIDGARRLLVP